MKKIVSYKKITLTLLFGFLILLCDVFLFPIKMEFSLCYEGKLYKFLLPLFIIFYISVYFFKMIKIGDKHINILYNLMIIPILIQIYYLAEKIMLGTFLNIKVTRDICSTFEQEANIYFFSMMITILLAEIFSQRINNKFCFYVLKIASFCLILFLTYLAFRYNFPAVFSSIRPCSGDICAHI